MPYINCSECGIRSFALAPWSTVHNCPTCEAPLAAPRQSTGADFFHRQDPPAAPPASLDDRRGGAREVPGTY